MLLSVELEAQLMPNQSPALPPFGGSWKGVPVPHDQAYSQAQNKIESVNHHPRITTTNSRMPARIRIFVTPFVDGTVENKGGHHGT
jgi:hypothetical protein